MKRSLFLVFALATFLLVELALYYALVGAPRADEIALGDVQRIFYWHVSSAVAGFLGLVVACVASIGYLATRKVAWDQTASSAVEVSLVFLTIVLITGSIWARAAWNAWWVWDARLTTMLILWLIYAAYPMLRSALEDPVKRANASAVQAILGFLLVPIVYMSTSWWRTMHPKLGREVARGVGALAPPMVTALLISMLAMFTMFCFLLSMRIRLERLSAEVNHLRQSALSELPKARV